MWILISIAMKLSGQGLCAIMRYFRAAKNSSDWPCVPGELLTCDLVERINANPAVYNLDVKYSYRMDGEAFESTQIMFYFWEWSSCRSYYVDLQTAITTQNSLSVYANPHNPRESVLFPGVDHVPIGLLPLAAIMMLVCPMSAALAIYRLLLN